MQEHYVPDLSGQIWNLMHNSHFHSSHSHIHLSADSKISQSDYVMFNQAKFPELLNRYSQAPVLVEHHHVNRLLHPQLHLYLLILIMRHVCQLIVKFLNQLFCSSSLPVIVKKKKYILNFLIEQKIMQL
jgi:hypothetical protein